MINAVDDVSGLMAWATSATDLPQLNAGIEAFSSRFGIDYFSGIARITGPNCEWQPPMFGTIMTEYVDAYFGERLHKIDPLSRRVETSISPFAWSISGFDKRQAKISARWIELNRDVNVHFGIVVPVHLPGCMVHLGVKPRGTGKEFLAGFSSLMSIVHIFSLSVAESALRITGKIPAQGGRSSLTARERECLCWIAEGKTAWEAAIIVGISESTVIFHVENAKRKLSAKNIAQAILLAVRRGLI